MCNLKAGFILFSCDGESLTRPDWILERRDRGRSMAVIRGKAMVPRLDPEEAVLVDMIAGALDQGDCFDFSYAPQDGDVLKIKSGERWYRLLFEAGRWGRDESTSLTGWRGQMVPHLDGCVKHP
jgi:hypothetical protein